MRENLGKNSQFQAIYSWSISESMKPMYDKI